MKTLWISTIGFSVGFGVSYLYYKNKFEKQTNEEVAAAREFYKKEKEDFVSELVATDVEVKKEEEVKEEKTEKADICINYNEIASSYAGDEKEADKPKKKSTGRKKKKTTEPGLIISEDEFLEMNGYEKKTIYFFNNDNLFTDETYHVLEGVNLIIGEDNLDAVGLYEDKVLYVRSDAYSTDYEVILNEDPYIEYVEG